MIFLSDYRLSRADAQALRLTDTYSLHRAVYELFEDARSGERQSSSGILFADKGGDGRERRLLILSDRLPRRPGHGRLETREIPDAFLDHAVYRFEIVVNPVRRDNRTGNIVAVRGRDDVARWFAGKCPAWGFSVAEESLQLADITVDIFSKAGHQVTLGKARVTGTLRVTDRKRFAESVSRGIGRGKAFGCGLLQVVPCA